VKENNQAAETAREKIKIKEENRKQRKPSGEDPHTVRGRLTLQVGTMEFYIVEFMVDNFIFRFLFFW
jgi:hypothetical protein